MEDANAVGIEHYKVKRLQSGLLANVSNPYRPTTVVK